MVALQLTTLLLDNNLSGYSPPEFSEFPSLLMLQVDNNFGGTTIPDSYSNMSKLFKLSLRNCNLQGPIPDLTVFQETSLSLANFVYPLFIHDGQDGTPIWAMLGCLGLGGDVDLWKRSIKQIRFRQKTPHLLPTMLMGRSIGNQSLFGLELIGMFKEATLEKKAHAPLKEITLVRTPGAKSTSKHQNVIQVLCRQNIGAVGHIWKSKRGWGSWCCMKLMCMRWTSFLSPMEEI